MKVGINNDIKSKQKPSIYAVVIVEKLRKYGWSEVNRNEMANRVNIVVNTIEKNGIKLIKPKIYIHKFKKKKVLKNIENKENSISSANEDTNNVQVDYDY